MASYKNIPNYKTNDDSNDFSNLIKAVFSGIAGASEQNSAYDKKQQEEQQKENKANERQQKINAYLESLGDDYDKEVTGFDEYGNPEIKAKMKKSKSETIKDPSNLIKDALMFDTNIPEVGKSMGMQPTAQGFPVAGGGGVLPSSAGGEYDLSQMQTIDTPDYSGMVRQALLDKTQPGVPKDKALNNVFGVKEEKLEEVIPPELESKISDMFSSLKEGQDPVEDLKKLIPLFSNNKAALERIKTLLNLFSAY